MIGGPDYRTSVSRTHTKDVNTKQYTIRIQNSRRASPGYFWVVFFFFFDVAFLQVGQCMYVITVLRVNYELRVSKLAKQSRLRPATPRAHQIFTVIVLRVAQCSACNHTLYYALCMSKLSRQSKTLLGVL